MNCLIYFLLCFRFLYKKYFIEFPALKDQTDNVNMSKCDKSHYSSKNVTVKKIFQTTLNEPY